MSALKITITRGDGPPCVLEIPENRSDLAVDASAHYASTALSGYNLDQTHPLSPVAGVVAATLGDLGEGYNRDVLKMAVPAGSIRNDLLRSVTIETIEEAPSAEV